MHTRTLKLHIVALAVLLASCGGGGDDSAPVTTASGMPGGETAAPSGSPAPAPVVNTPAPQATLSWSSPAGLAPMRWHWTVTNPSGSVMVATAIPEGVFVSRDGGSNWTAAAGLSTQNIWISADVSDDGQVIVAVSQGGGLVRSLDSGSSWGRIDAAFNPAGDLQYQSVSVSADGTRVVAAVAGGAIWTSANGTSATPVFTEATASDGTALASWWRAVDSDASGQRVAAASHNGDVWTSNDGGRTFSPLPVSVGGAAVVDGWYRLALSRDGSTLALAGSEDYGIGVPAPRSTGLYVGRLDAGTWNFRRASDVRGSYTHVTIAAAAPVIAATLSGPTGAVLLSSDNGTSFSPLATPAGESLWRSIAVTGDGNRALLAAGTFQTTPGNLYRSQGQLRP